MREAGHDGGEPMIVTHEELPARAVEGGQGRRFIVLLAALATVLAVTPTAAADAEVDSESRGIERVCPDAAQNLDRFVDVSAGTHFETINCIGYYEITRGSSSNGGGRAFAPQDPVTRGQMATFTTRMIELVLQEELPMEVAFRDDDVVHQANIRKLATAGIVRGVGDDVFAPGRNVTRAQMATFVAKAIEEIVGEELPSEARFDDATGTHQTSIEKLTAVGVVTGLADGTYGPDQAITREQMSAFLARGMDVVAEYDAFPEFVEPVDGVPTTDPWESAPASGVRALTGLAIGSHERFDRVRFDVEGADGAGWRLEYVSEARRPGTEDVLEVDGGAILRLTIIGVDADEELPEGVETWVEDRLDAPLDNVVTEVVNAGVRRGLHTVFIGTTEALPMIVEHLSDPQRIVVDVFRGFTPPSPTEILPPLEPPPEPEVVASFTTSLVAGQARNTNIHLAADYIDGDVIPSGGTYSLNQGIGPRTRDRGFVSNGFISDGDLISVVGGGVSQMGTTFLNAAWDTGIRLDAFRQHTIYFPRYPMCREATLAWNQLDVRVTNDSPHQITVSTSYTDTSVTVEFISIPWAEVSSWIGEPTNVVGGVGGAFSVSCGRTVTYPDGSTSSDSYSWRYNEGYPG